MGGGGGGWGAGGGWGRGGGLAMGIICNTFNGNGNRFSEAAVTNCFPFKKWCCIFLIPLLSGAVSQEFYLG